MLVMDGERPVVASAALQRRLEQMHHEDVAGESPSVSPSGSDRSYDSTELTVLSDHGSGSGSGSGGNGSLYGSVASEPLTKASPASSTALTIVIDPALARPPPSASRFHVSDRILVSAVANLSTAYNLAVINYAMIMIRQTYPPSSPELTSMVASCSLVGAILGQLTFGYIGAAIGRKKAMIFTLVLSIVGAAASALCPWSKHNVYETLALCRFILGLGVGGVYPLSATTAVESSHDETKNSKMVAAVFSFQGIGQLLAPLVAVLLLEFGLPRFVGWRVLLGVGALPGLFVLKQAFHAKEVVDHLPSGKPVHHDPAREDLWQRLSTDRELRDKFVGAALGWFLFDVTFYGNVIFTPIILEDTYGFDKHHLLDVALCALVVAGIGLPGYYVTVALVGRLSFKTIQILGFVVMAILFLLLGAFYNQLLDFPSLLLTLYALTFFFSNFGPNVSTFSLPAEIFPPDVRVKLNGISAACGKLGATVGAAAFGLVEQQWGVSSVLIMSALASVLGMIVTYRYIPAKQYH